MGGIWDESVLVITGPFMSQPVITGIFDLHLEFDHQLFPIESLAGQGCFCCRKCDLLPAGPIGKPVVMGNPTHGYFHGTGYIGKPVIQRVGIHHLCDRGRKGLHDICPVFRGLLHISVRIGLPQLMGYRSPFFIFHPGRAIKDELLRSLRGKLLGKGVHGKRGQVKIGDRRMAGPAVFHGQRSKVFDIGSQTGL